MSASSFKEHRFSFHYRDGCRSAKIAQSQNGAPVADDCQAIFLDRQGEGVLFITGNRPADARDAGGVDEREIVAALERRATVNGNLAALVQ